LTYMMIPTRVLKYVKGAVGETDVPDAFPEFISQRRRWLNGSFFATTYAIAHVGQILRSGHSFARKMFLTVETIYNVINLIFSWFSIVRTALSLPARTCSPYLYFQGKLLHILCKLNSFSDQSVL
jgi:cellulose synthase/poly-beta-1,6-N-acetylglucosamine synthase-like glycosyltransferase